MNRRNIIKKLLLWLLLLAVAAGGIAILYGIRPVYLKSGSMEPALPVGSLCFVNTKIELSTLEPGDIIVFSAGEMQVAHRIIEETKEGFRTKGDANDSPDPGIVFPEQVTGKILAAIPYLGYATAFLRSKAGIALLLFLFGVFLIYKNRKERKNHAGSNG